MICIGCEIKEEVKSLNVENLITEQLELEQNLADEQTIKRRLAICEICPKRSFHTCTKCGCFCKFRASLAEKNCPQAKW